MSDLLRELRDHNPRNVLRAVKSTLSDALSHSAPLTSEDERMLAEQANLERGYNLPRWERSKRAHELAEGAPLVRYAVRPAR